MNIRKLLLTPNSITVFAMIVALTFPCVVEAVSVGEVVSQSKLGEPLFAQVGLTLGSGEHIEDSCLSLVAPDPNDEDNSSYLTIANLSLKTEGKRLYVDINSRKLFNDAFARLRLQVKCTGADSVIKTLTILSDLDSSITQAQITTPNILAETEYKSAPSPSNAHDIVPDSNQRDTRNAQHDVEKHLANKVARPVHKRHPQPTSALTASINQSRSATFKLTLSGYPIDESRIGKISAEERELLLAWQKLPDADNQMASFLSMQHQVKQLQDELGEIKLQLTQLGVTPSIAASSATMLSATPLATVDAQGNRPKSDIAVKQQVVQQGNQYLQNELYSALGLVLVILALWVGLRYYTKIKSQQDAEPMLKLIIATPKIALSAVAKPSQAKNDHVSADVVHPKANTARSEVVPPSASPQKIIEEEVTQENSMLEEAKLYVNHGHPATAVKILQEIIKLHPEKADAWALLLSIYSSLSKAVEFENTAREFLKHSKSAPSWSGIQALGRTFDKNNPLYVDNSSNISVSPMFPHRRPVGDILMGIGILSKQYLQKYLDDFDPKNDGRFGGYLVKRKAITLAQLDQALLFQQGVLV